MVNIFRSILYSVIGLSVIGWASVLLISVMLVGPDADSFLTQYFADNILNLDLYLQVNSHMH